MVVPAVISAAGSLAAGGLNYWGSHQANVATQSMSKDQMAFEERMSGTAYQRAMEDMRKAGLNPILAAQRGGATTPGGSMANMQNELQGAVSSAIDAKRMFAELANLKELNKKIQSDTDISKAQAELLRQAIPGARQEADIDRTTFGQMMRFIQRLNPFTSSASSLMKAFK